MSSAWQDSSAISTVSAPAVPKARVLIIVENLPLPFDRRAWSEATTLARAGYQVCVICPKGYDATKSLEEIDGIRIYRHPLPREGNGAFGYLLEYSAALFWEFVLSLRIFFTHGFDIIHACNPPDLIFLIGGFFKFLFGCKFVFDHHDLSPELYLAKFGRKDFFWRLMVGLERLTFSIADMTVATNASYRAVAIERDRMDPKQVHIVRSGPNMTKVREVAPDETWKRGRGFLVAYVGVIGKQEGLDLLMDAARYIKIARGRNDVQFVIAGSGPECGAVEQLAHQIGVDDIVTFTGRISDDDLFSLLSTADVCVNPDRPNALNDRSTMNKIMEYMALGRPIVQFDLTEGRVSAQGASLYAHNGDCEDFGDKIIALLDDPQRRKTMGELGRTRILKELAWEYEAPKLLAAYRSLQSGD